MTHEADPSQPIQPTEFTFDAVDGLEFVGQPVSSVPVKREYDDVQKLETPVYEGTVVFSQAFRWTGKGAVDIKGKIRSMACDASSCTPPFNYRFDMVFGNSAAGVSQSQTAAPAAPAVATDSQASAGSNSGWWEPVSMESAVDTDQPSAWAILLIGFAGGLLALLTPCVWPMIPMTMSFFLKKGRSRSKSIADAVTYGVSIVVIYLILGIGITLLFGASKLNDIATSAVFNLIFFALLVVFAISFFGAFDIKLPSRWSNKMDSRAEATTGALSIFFMAFTLVLVSFSCTGPIIGTLLVEAASQGSLLGPALGMGGFALGLALPFALFAFFPSLLKEMPKSGGWLNSVKVVLGFIELILSLKFLSVADLAYGWHILDREVFLSLWIVLFVLLGMYLLGKLRFSHDSPSQHTGVLSFFLAVISFSFAVYLVPGLWGAPLKSISAFAPPLTTQDFNLYGGTFREFDDYDEGMKYAKDNNLPVLVDFSGFACVNCRKMEGAVFDTSDVRDIVENGYVLIKLMVDDKAPLAKPYEVEENGSPTLIETVGEKWSYLQRNKFGISSQPYYVILNNEGAPLMPARVYDENVDAFVKWLNEGAEKYQSGK
ncbi:MAG: thioredoxin family protein, partial [Muribaculaceae bacterium]|nr:thioredoxin family protein [Muribaculaceae bacterium]